jgi:hypothetical protein
MKRVLLLIPAVLTASMAVLTAVAFANGSSHVHGQHAGHVHVAATAKISAKELKLRNSMRALWEDHITWTRLAIISLTSGSPDTQATVGRLLQNQTDIGNAVKPFYGKAAGDQLTKLLRGHILIAADVIAAAKAGDQNALTAAQAKWEQNAAEIAALLSSANPNWKRAAVQAMLDQHLKLTTEEAVARLQGNWDADVAAYDRVHAHALHMADTLSAGLVKQFPKRFR